MISDLMKLKTIAKIELEKILRKRSTAWIGLLILILFVAAGLIEYTSRMRAGDFGTGYQIATFSLKIALQLFWLITLVIASMILSEEITSGTVKYILTRNVKRRDLILGKFFALIGLCSVGLVLLHLIGLVLGHFFGGLSAIKEGEYLLFSAADLLRCYLGGMVLSIPPMIALIAFGTLVSIVVKGSGGAVGTAVIGYFFLQILSQIKSLHDYLFIRYLFLPIDHMNRLIDGIYADWTRYIYWNIGVSTISIALLMGSAILIFKRKDIWY